MGHPTRPHAAAIALAALALTACQAMTTLQPATLSADTPEARAALIEAIRPLTAIPAPRMGAVDLTASSEVPVLPPEPSPFEGNSPARPEMFEIVTDGTDCYVQPVKTPAGATEKPRTRLPGLMCRALAKP